MLCSLIVYSKSWANLDPSFNYQFIQINGAALMHTLYKHT